jgi:hypothetical protein
MLPAELRNTIYDLVLCLQPTIGPDDNDNIVSVRHDRSRKEKDYVPPLKPSVLSILQTCRQINHEAEQVFYSSNNLRYTLYSFEFLPIRPWPVEWEKRFIDPDVARTEGKSFIRSLGPQRRRALHALTFDAPTPRRALMEITENLPLATNLRVLHLQLPLLAWSSDNRAIAWAREVQAALRTTRIKEVRILHPSTPNAQRTSLGRGGAGNNSYAVIRERSRSERAWELSRVIEGMLRSIVED